jgi:hypothetical protein
MAWRAARSLLVFHQQLRAAAPRAAAGTDPDAWGLIGDTSHSSTSDHSPHDFPGWGNDIVTAADIPHAPTLGLDARKVLDDIRRSHDPRMKYVISNGQIASSYPAHGYDAWTWRPYSGDDGHFTHGHLSVVGDARADGTAPWATIGADVNQGDQLNPPYPPAPATTVGNALNIGVETRQGLWVDVNATGHGAPKPASALGLIIGKLDALLARPAVPSIDLPALAAALAPLLDDSLDASAVLGVLKSPEGQAALAAGAEAGANAAEDG